MLFFIVPFLACWGSFLNLLAYRLVHDDIAFGNRNSTCPKCYTKIAWYDLIPVFSWLILTGKCRACQQGISKFYPLVELLTIGIGLLVYFFCESIFWPAYFAFCSLLIITIRTDLETMLISRFTTIFALPIPISLSLIKFNKHALLSINFWQAITGALFGYLILFLINKVFWLITKKNGMGEGDMDLLALIGAFTGVCGAWLSLMLGAFLGSLVGIILIYQKTNRLQTQLPFGPFLAFGAMSYLLFENYLLSWLFY